MIKIDVHNSLSRIVEGDVPFQAFNFLRVPYYVMVSKPRGKGKGYYPAKELRYKKLFNKQNLTFPTGMLFKLIHYFEDEWDEICEIEDNRRILYDKRNIKMKLKFTPWEHQLLACAEAVDVGRGVIALPTASGKTVTAGLLIQHIGRPTLFMVNGLDLFRQARKEFESMFPGERIGTIGEGAFDPDYITVGMMQSLWLHRDDTLYEKYLKEIDVFIGDECHHVSVATGGKKKKDGTKKKFVPNFPGNMMYTLIQATNAHWRFGLSATPGLEGSPRRALLRACLGSILYTATYEELRAKGILADVRVLMVETPRLEHVKGWRNAYDTVIQKGYTMNNLVLSIAEMLHDRDYATLIMANRLNITRRIVEVDEKGKTSVTKVQEEGHAKILVSELRDRGLDTVLLSGSTSSDERGHHLDRLNQHDLLLAVSTLLKEGIDVPYLNAVLYACGGRAAVAGGVDTGESESPASIQAVGRVIRNPKDKGRAIHIDFIHKDGGVLEEHSEERFQAYREHGFPVRRVSPNAVVRAIDEWMNG